MIARPVYFLITGLVLGIGGANCWNGPSDINVRLHQFVAQQTAVRSAISLAIANASSTVQWPSNSHAGWPVNSHVDSIRYSSQHQPYWNHDTREFAFTLPAGGATDNAALQRLGDTLVSSFDAPLANSGFHAQGRSSGSSVSGGKGPESLAIWTWQVPYHSWSSSVTALLKLTITRRGEQVQGNVEWTLIECFER